MIHPPPEDHPSIDLPLQNVFASFKEYTAIIGYGAIEEYEFIKSLNELMEVQATLRALSIPHKGTSCYLVLLTLLSYRKPRFISANCLQIFFNPEHTEKEDGWTMEVILAIPGSLIGDVSGLLFRPLDKRTMVHDETIKIDAAPHDHLSLKAQASAYIKATRIPVITTHRVFDKIIKRQLVALAQFTHNAEDVHFTRFRNLLTGHDIYSDKAADLFHGLDSGA